MMLDRVSLVRVIFQVLALNFLLQICWARDFPALYIFGDSLVDVGNNLYLEGTVARPEFPNGIDFGNPRGTPSGRYSNGKIVIDLLEQESGLKILTPPYSDPTTTEDVILKGVNYASSGAGILDETGSGYAKVIPLTDQISNFVKTRQNIIAKLGNPAAQKLLKSAIYILAIGSNDVMLLGRDESQKPKSLYLDTIISRFKSHLAGLYKLGARKFLVVDMGAMGCIPNERDWHPFILDRCIGSVNQLAQAYNRRLRRLLHELRANLTGSVFVLANSYAMTENIITNYTSFGFEVVDEACCHLLGSHGGLLPCFQLSQVCQNRSKYVFWDAWHLTERANLIVAKYMMDGGPNYMWPMNFRRLLNSSVV